MKTNKKSNDSKQIKTESKINAYTLSFQDQETEMDFINQKISNKMKITMIDAVGVSLIFLIIGIQSAIKKDLFFSVIYFCGFIYLNIVTLIGRKYSKLFQPTLLIHLFTQIVILTEYVAPILDEGNHSELHLTLIITYVRHSYFLSLMDSWTYRFASLLLWMYYPLRNITSTNIDKTILFFIFFIQMIWIFYFDNKAERMWFVDQCSIKEDLKFWKTLFKKNLQSVVFVISVSKLNDIQVDFCNDQGLKDFRAKSKTDFQQKILNDFHINLFENRQYQLFKDFIYQKYMRQQVLSPMNLENQNLDQFDTAVKDVESAKIKNENYYAGNTSKDIRLDEHIYMNSFYIDSKNSKKLYYDVKLVNCSWKNQFGIMAFLTNVPQNNLVNRLQKINQYKDELLATVSHDLKTPLNAMIQVVQTAMNECKNEVYVNYFDIIEKNSKLLLNIINDILDYSQILKGKLRLTLQMFSIRQVIQEVHDLLKYQFQDKGIEFLIDIEQDIQVQNDQNRLKQILNNIIGNALKFTFKGYVKVRVVPSQENQAIQISVEDTGTGIEQSLQPKLFQLYSTFDHNKGSNKHGVGLGLAICKKLVQLMGPQDSIQLLSEKGKGSKFIFEIYSNLDVQKANQKTKSALFESRRSLDNSSLIYSPEYKKPTSLNLFQYSNSMNNQDLMQSFVMNQQVQQQQQQQQQNTEVLLNQQQQSSKHAQSLQYNAVSTFSHLNSNTNFTSAMKSHNPMTLVTNSQYTNIFSNYGMSAPSLTGYLPQTHRQQILNGILENNEEGNYLESEKQLPYPKKLQDDMNSISGQPFSNSINSKTPAHNRFQQDNMNFQFKILSQNEIDDDQSKSLDEVHQQSSEYNKINTLFQSNNENIMNYKNSPLNIENQADVNNNNKQHFLDNSIHPKNYANIDDHNGAGILEISPHFLSVNPNTVAESQELIEFKRDEEFNDLKGHIENNYTFIVNKKYQILESYMKQQLKRILIVDDTPFNIRALKILLDNVITSSTVEILQAFNGQQSIEILEQCFADNKQVDIIFMDINMPVMDGYEATKKIRTMPQFNDTKIILATAYSEYFDTWKQTKTGADGYLQKPIQRTEIVRIFKNLSLQAFDQQKLNQ